MNHRVPRRVSSTSRKPAGGRPAFAAALCCLSILYATSFSFLPGPSAADARPAVLRESVRPCLPCHHRQDNDQIGEWLASPYSEVEGGRGCVNCHGRHCAGNNSKRARLPDASVVPMRRPPEAARLSVTATCSGDAVETEVAVSNVGTGHLLPTGPRAQALILEVVAHDWNRQPLRLRTGSMLSRGAGPTAGGAAGRMFFKDVVPSARPDSSHPPLPPFATDVSRYRFASPVDGPALVSARLVLVSPTAPPIELANTATPCTPSGEKP